MINVSFETIPQAVIFNPYPPLANFFTAFWIIAGLWVISKLAWMVIYQMRYGGNAGELYLKGEWRKKK